MFDSLSLPILLLVFGVTAAIVWRAGVSLSNTTDILSKRFKLGEALVMNASSNRPDTVMLVYARFSRRHTNAERYRIQKWLQSRTKSKHIKLIVK